MAAVAQAKSSDDVAAAIEAVALPTGSARIKRESESNVSLNAYCGLFGAQNRTKFWSKPEYSGGVTAPIGFAASWGHSVFPFSTGTKNGWSSSIFVSIIDLGAVAAYRFSNSTDSVPHIKLEDIISPGLFLSLGFPKSPISFNMGCQMAPLLSSVRSSSNSFGSKTFRFTGAICVDLPILNFYTKSKEK